MSFLEQAKAGLGKAGGFIFGAGTETPTYESLKKRREVAELLAQQAVGGTPQNFGEGIASVGRALAYKLMDKRLAPQEAEMGEQSRSRLMEIAGLLGGGGGSVGGSPAPSLGGYSGQPPAMPQGDMATTIRQGLVQRGLPEHVADGFVLNMQDESGLNPGINEIAPTVPGSRGGFGLAQWTGPRREGLEQFAAQQGRAIDDANLQLDYLMAELGGPESKAAQAIMSTKDAGSAAAAIASEFLRPAPEHLQRRVAEYTGGAMPSYGGGGGIGFDPTMMAELADLAGNEYLKPGERMVAQALIQRMMEQPESINPLEAARYNLDAQRFGLEQARFERDGQPKPTDDMREYEFAKSQGYGGTFQEFVLTQKRAGAPSVTTNVGPNEQADAAFLQKLDAAEGDTFSELLKSGPTVQQNAGNIGILEQQLANTPQGAQGAWVQFAGSLGLPVEGVSDVQAAQATINALVPEQRTPGSGPMSDADLALFKQSLPQIINQPGGNQLIIARMKAINAYQAEMAKIANAVVARQMSRADARKAMAAVPNPLEGYKAEIAKIGQAPAAPGEMPDWMVQSDVTTWTDEQMLEAERLWGLQK